MYERDDIHEARQGEEWWIPGPVSCDRRLRGGGYCNMEEHHSGRCTSQAWRCTICGKTRRGTRHTDTPDGPICFMCGSEQVNGPWWRD